MKFVQKDLGDSAEASNGGGERGLLREFAVLTGALLALALAAYFAIGWITDLTLPLISAEREAAWFGKFAPSAGVKEDLPPELAAKRDRAAELLQKMAADSAVPHLPYRLFVLQGAEPNAFAFPGGAIGVTRGLLETLDSDTAVAFVLGHELGHFAQRDHLRGLGRRIGRSIVWALVFGSDGGDALSGNVGALLDLGYSRDQESGADLFGLDLVHRVMGTTENVDQLFVWMETRERFPVWATMLATHPHSKERLAALRAHAAELITKGEAPSTTPSSSGPAGTP